MAAYILRRLIVAVPTLIIISMLTFGIMKLPPTDYLQIRIQELRDRGDYTAERTMAQYRERYGLDLPGIKQYTNWVTKFVRGDFGMSFEYERPVRDVIGERLPLTIAITVGTLLFTYAVAIPIGIFCARHQYSILDYIFSFLAFIGLATPSFLLALIVMFALLMYGSQSVGGLFSPEYIEAAWSMGKFFDLLKHLWLPVVIIGASGAASLVRIMRANLLDVLGHQFVTTARAKGVKEGLVVYKHAVRVAINPLISIIGLTIPNIIAGDTLVANILVLPTTGPIFVRSLQVVDMYLAGTFLMFFAIMVVAGNLLADIMLAWVDPRIRFE